MRLAAGILLLSLAAGPALAAATPDGAVADCRRPGSDAERAVCASPALQAADLALASLVADWRQRAPEAAAQQQDWLRRRDRMCAPAMRPDCLDIAYAERTAWLRAALAALPTPMPAPPAAAPAPMPPPVPAEALAPRPAPAAVAVASMAARLATAPCATVGSTALRGQGWGVGDAPFGLALDRWSQPDFAALMRRARECQAENVDNARNLQLMLNVLNQLRATAPALPPAAPAVPRPPAPPQPAPPPEPARQPAATAIDCADPALLQDVAFTFQGTPGVSRGARIRQMLRPRPYSDVITEAYGATPALRAEFQRLQPFMAPVPQCLVDAETDGGAVTLSYRLYADAGRMLIEVQRMP